MTMNEVMQLRLSKAGKTNVIIEKEERLHNLLDDLDSGDIPNCHDISVEAAEREVEILKRQIKRLHGSR